MDAILLRVIEMLENARCVECNRVWDLNDEDDANDYYYGHDCEEES